MRVVRVGHHCSLISAEEVVLPCLHVACIYDELTSSNRYVNVMNLHCLCVCVPLIHKDNSHVLFTSIMFDDFTHAVKESMFGFCWALEVISTCC
jgi:hypothetical protein